MSTKEKLTIKVTTTIINIGMHYIYRLNLPPIKNVVDEHEFNSLIKNEPFIKKGHISVPAAPLFQSIFLKSFNFKFTRMSAFYKPDSTGNIHVDDPQRLRNENEPILWAINWIHNGTCKMKFWSPINAGPCYKNPDAIGTYHMKFEPSSPPDKVYLLDEKQPYLVNASIPHSAQGIGKRYSFSLRIEKPFLPGNEWTTVVEKFKDLIIPW
jgi:hypothetical protein